MTDESLRDLFAEAGTVVSAFIVKDKMTGRSKGFGFVEMASPEEAAAAIARFNEQEVEGRKMMVSEARPMEQK